MEEIKKPKTVKEVFKDYNSSSFELINAKVMGINLYKRLNTLEIVIESTKLINIKEILELEKYIEKRFQVKEARISINYNLEPISRDEISQKIVTEWESIIEYISHKHPIAKAFLKNSSIMIEKNKIAVTLSLNGKEFLESNKFNDVFSGLIQNIYGEKYQINYIENVEENAISQYKENIEKQEKETILELTKENGNSEHNTQKKVVQQAKPKYNKKPAQNVKVQAKASNVPVEAPPPPETEDGDSPLIYGRNINLKDAITKIQDISVDSGNVIIEGKLVKL